MKSLCCMEDPQYSLNKTVSSVGLLHSLVASLTPSVPDSKKDETECLPPSLFCIVLSLPTFVLSFFAHSILEFDGITESIDCRNTSTFPHSTESRKLMYTQTVEPSPSLPKYPLKPPNQAKFSGLINIVAAVVFALACQPLDVVWPPHNKLCHDCSDKPPFVVGVPVFHCRKFTQVKHNL